MLHARSDALAEGWTLLPISIPQEAPDSFQALPVILLCCRWLVEGGLSLVGQHPPLPAPPAAPAEAPGPSSSSPPPALPAGDATGAAAGAANGAEGGNGGALDMLRSYSATSHDESQEPGTPAVTSAGGTAAAAVAEDTTPAADAADHAAPAVQQQQQQPSTAAALKDGLGLGKETPASDAGFSSMPQQAAGPPGPPSNKGAAAAPAEAVAAPGAAAPVGAAMPAVPPVAAIIAKLVAAVRKAGPQFEVGWVIPVRLPLVYSSSLAGHL
jgi:hypothetical protein